MWVRSLGWKTPWMRAWQPTPVFLPGGPHGQRSLVGYSPWGCQELYTTEQRTFRSHQPFSAGSHTHAVWLLQTQQVFCLESLGSLLIHFLDIIKRSKNILKILSALGQLSDWEIVMEAKKYVLPHEVISLQLPVLYLWQGETVDEYLRGLQPEQG